MCVLFSLKLLEFFLFADGHRCRPDSFINDLYITCIVCYWIRFISLFFFFRFDERSEIRYFFTTNHQSKYIVTYYLYNEQNEFEMWANNTIDHGAIDNFNKQDRNYIRAQFLCCCFVAFTLERIRKSSTSDLSHWFLCFCNFPVLYSLGTHFFLDQFIMNYQDKHTFNSNMSLLSFKLSFFFLEILIAIKSQIVWIHWFFFQPCVNNYVKIMITVLHKFKQNKTNRISD